MQNVIERIGLEEDVPIEAGMVSGSVRRAQEQVESQNFQIRKRILEYDDVLNKQRRSTYKARLLMGGPVTPGRTARGLSGGRPARSRRLTETLGLSRAQPNHRFYPSGYLCNLDVEPSRTGDSGDVLECKKRSRRA